MSTASSDSTHTRSDRSSGQAAFPKGNVYMQIEMNWAASTQTIDLLSFILLTDNLQ